MRTASVVAAFILMACATEEPKPERVEPRSVTPPPIQTPQQDLGRQTPLEDLPSIDLKIGDRSVSVYVANNDETRREGLMFVEKDELGADEGMIFVFARPSYQGFWMQNTLIPLDIAYVRSNGTIIEVIQMTAFDESSYYSSEPAQYAVEMHSGWFAENGIAAGDKFDLSALADLD